MLKLKGQAPHLYRVRYYVEAYLSTEYYIAEDYETSSKSKIADFLRDTVRHNANLDRVRITDRKTGVTTYYQKRGTKLFFSYQLGC